MQQIVYKTRGSISDNHTHTPKIRPDNKHNIIAPLLNSAMLSTS